MNTFQPDLIVEVTGACNRACVGCYAPNVVAKDAGEVYEKRPELFISVAALNNAWNELEVWPHVTAIRGGEPTLHPKLPVLLIMAANKSNQVFLETHGRWLLPESVANHQELIKTIQEKKIIVKLSFDKMHRMKKEELQKITDFLNWHEIDYRIAITEASLADYLESRSLCYFVSEDKIIFQQKASSSNELVKAIIGTINVRGEIKETLNHKFKEEISLGVALQ